MMLDIDSITMNFGGVVALDNISMSVKEGQIHGIIGPNGSGKTTMFNVINGICKPTSGKITFMGEDITGLPSHKITQKGIARTFQLLRVFPSMTVLDNLIVALSMNQKDNVLDALVTSPRMRHEEKAMREKAIDVLQLIGLESKAYNFAEDTSIGQRRMLQLGMGIVSDPKLLLLDECAAGLDPLNLDKLIELVFYARNELGITILMIEHIMSVVMTVCEELTVFDYGEKIFVGPPQEAQQHPAVIEAYLGSQD